MVTATKMTLNEFLELPETEPPSEFVCGRIIPKPMPTWFHSRLAAEIAFFFRLYFRDHPEGYVNVELRHAEYEEERAYLPDVSVTTWKTSNPSLAERRHGAIESPPDIAIEISSPDDRPGRIADKLVFYLRVGVPLTWIVDADDRTISVYRPGRSVEVFGTEDTLDASPVLSDFNLELAELFGVLDEGSRQA